MTVNTMVAVSQDVSQYSIGTLAQRCLKAEEDRSLSANSLKELRRYLKEFVTYCQEQTIASANELTPAFLQTYIGKRCSDKGPLLKKAVVWALRKFGQYLALIQVVQQNPASQLRHPKLHPRSQLPKYLCSNELRALLSYSASHLNQRDFIIISLLASAGLRPNEIAKLKHSDVYLDQLRLDILAKGGWCKKTPICQAMAALLADYLKTRNGVDTSLFQNNRSRPVTVSYIQRLIKKTGKKAGLCFSLTCNHLRHTYATYAADRNSKVITKALLGHQRLATTEIYTHLSPSYFRPLAKDHPFKRTGGES